MSYWPKWLTAFGTDQPLVTSEPTNEQRDAAQPPRETSRPAERPRTPPRGPQTTEDLVDDLLALRRYALLLRPETRQHLSERQLARAITNLDEDMALVPAGYVLLGALAEQETANADNSEIDPKSLDRHLVSIESVYLDRYCVTNEEFQQFVDSGGYEQLEFWHEEALPALLDFVDQTADPGPRFWTAGRFPDGADKLPVVGVSWYEACAYGRWVGKRLPTDAEWTKAGAWPVEAAPGRVAQRRYPWGESFDVHRANLFASNARGPLDVRGNPDGVSVGGIQQLVGNVWEWTSSPLCEVADSSLHVSESVISIRGGAFDTYFESQATCHYQSGEHRLSRRPNIGFRLALAIDDVEGVVFRAPEFIQSDRQPPAPAGPRETVLDFAGAT